MAAMPAFQGLVRARHMSRCRDRAADLCTICIFELILVAATTPPRAVPVASYAGTTPPVAVAITTVQAIAMAVGAVSVVAMVTLTAPPASTIIVISLSHCRNGGGQTDRSRYCQSDSVHHTLPFLMGAAWRRTGLLRKKQTAVPLVPSPACANRAIGSNQSNWLRLDKLLHAGRRQAMRRGCTGVAGCKNFP